jgi:hypothetical protein
MRLFGSPNRWSCRAFAVSPSRLRSSDRGPGPGARRGRGGVVSGAWAAGAGHLAGPARSRAAPGGQRARARAAARRQVAAADRGWSWWSGPSRASGWRPATCSSSSTTAPSARWWRRPSRAYAGQGPRRSAQAGRRDRRLGGPAPGRNQPRPRRDRAFAHRGWRAGRVRRPPSSTTPGAPPKSRGAAHRREAQQLAAAPLGADSRVALTALLQAQAQLEGARVRLAQTLIVARDAGTVLVRARGRARRRVPSRHRRCW